MNPADPKTPQPLKPHRAILEAEIRQAEDELRRPVHSLLVSGLLAGLGVGTSMFLLVAVNGAGGAAGAAGPLLLGSVFSVGFIIVVLARVDLFTEYTTIAILPVLTGRAAPSELIRLWALVYLGNQIGALLFAGFAVWLAPALGVADADAFRDLGERMTRHGWLITAGSALLAGWLMGLLSWLIAASRDTISQIVFVWIIAGTIGATSLHHSITGAAEVAGAMLVGGGPSLGAGARFLVWATLGNAIGGVLFAVLIRFGLVVHERSGSGRRDAPAPARARRGEDDLG